MKLNRWIASVLWRRPLARGVRNPQPEIEQTASEERVQASSDHLDFIAATPPPLVNTAHDDLAWKLDDYTGYPAPGALTPGMIAAVVKGKHIVALGAAGFAKLPEQTPMTEDIIFNIGSNTKSMTATLLSIRIEESPALDWDTTLAEALPWATEPGKAYIKPAARKNVTLRQLVAHRSGIACSYEVGDATVDNQLYSHPDYSAGWKSKTHQQVLKEYVRGPSIPVGGNAGLLATASDTIGVYRYENANFTIAQAVIDQSAAWRSSTTPERSSSTRTASGPPTRPPRRSSSRRAARSTAPPRRGPTGIRISSTPRTPIWPPGSSSGAITRRGRPTRCSIRTWTPGPSHRLGRVRLQHPRLGPLRHRPHARHLACLHQRPRAGLLKLQLRMELRPPLDQRRHPVYRPVPLRLDHGHAVQDLRLPRARYRLSLVRERRPGPRGRRTRTWSAGWRASRRTARTTGGCKDDPALVTGVQRFWDDEMFGCAGA